MNRVVVDHYGGPEVLKVVDGDDPRPGPGEVRVRVLAAGVSFTDSQACTPVRISACRSRRSRRAMSSWAWSRSSGRRPLRLRVGDRVGTVTVWGADAERVCLREEDVVEVPEDLDPAEALSLLFTYMTAYQVLHRMAKVQSGETVLVHGAAGRVGTAELELGALAGVRLYGTASARRHASVERQGAVAIDYQREDFLARVHELPGRGVHVVLDSLGPPLSLRSFRPRCGPVEGWSCSARTRRSWMGTEAPRKWIEWYHVGTAALGLWGLLPPPPSNGVRVQKLYDGDRVVPFSSGPSPRPVGGAPRYREWFKEDFAVLAALLADKIHPVVAERLPLIEARHAHELLENRRRLESSCSCPELKRGWPKARAS